MSIDQHNGFYNLEEDNEPELVVAPVFNYGYTDVVGLTEEEFIKLGEEIGGEYLENEIRKN